MSCGPVGSGLPRGMIKIMELLQWADWPRYCRPLDDYRADAGLYFNLHEKVRRGKANRKMARRGP